MSFRYSQGDRPLPGYTIQRGVGKGGFGEVYYATSDGGKEVALKYLRENPAIEVRGAQHCLNLKSPYLVDLHDIRQNADGDFFVVMEFVHGSSLRDLMNSEPHGLGTQKAAYLVREIGKGLAYLHDRGIVHRDLKPGNIFYEDGYVKIGDYGLAKVMATSQHSGQTISVGTVHYMAPEVGSGNYDKTIDLYALGVILYEMVLGKVPFAGSSMGEVLMKHLTAQPAVDELPEPFPTVIRKALAKEPRDRYQSVQEMMTDLFAVADLDRSVAAFEPNSLTVAAARVARDLAAKKTPVAVGAPGSSNVANATPPPIVHQDLLADRRAFQGMDAAFGGGAGARISPGSGPNIESPKRPGFEHSDPPSKPGPPAIARFLATLGMVMGISLTAGVLCAADRPAIGGAVFLDTFALIQGVLLGSWLAFEKLHLSDKWLPRILITCVTAPALLPGGMVLAIESDFRNSIPVSMGGVLLLGLMLMDWPRRVALARKGEMSLKSALLAGLFGWIAAAIMLGENSGLPVPVAAIFAAASLAVQALSRIRGKAATEIAGAAAFSTTPGDPWAAALTPVEEKEAYGRRAVPAVAVELPTAAAPGMPPPMPAGSPPVIAYANMPAPAIERVERSGTVRALWLVAAMPFFATGVILYILTGLGEISGRDEEAAALIVATSCMLFGLACGTRSFSRWQRGWWRGLARPGITALGISATAGAGIFMGVTNPRGEELVVSVIFLVVGIMLFLGSWIVPARLFDSQAAAAAAPSKPQSEALQRTHATGRTLIKCGQAGIVLALVLLVIILTTVREHDWDEAIPGTMIPIGTISMVLLGIGAMKTRKTAETVVVPVTLPIRRDFDVAASPNLSKLIERHMVMLGYALANRSDMLWQFTRGSFASQFWSSDVRQWGTRVNIAAYELDSGGYRVSCLLDIERMFNSPTKDMKAVLDAELRELGDMLAGREVAVGSSMGGLLR